MTKVPPVASDEESQELRALLERGARREAVGKAVELLGEDLGRYAMAMLGDQRLAEQVQVATLVDFFSEAPETAERPVRARIFALARRKCLAMRERTPTEVVPTTGAALALRPEEKDNGPLCPSWVRAELDGLSALDRDLVALRYLARLDYAELAGVCQLDEPKVRKRIGKVLLRLRERRRALGSVQVDGALR